MFQSANFGTDSVPIFTRSLYFLQVYFYLGLAFPSSFRVKLLSMLRLQKRCSSNISNYLTVAISLKALSTSASKVEAAFSDANAATFLAAATTLASIPKLQGLSEVIVAGAYKLQWAWNIFLF